MMKHGKCSAQNGRTAKRNEVNIDGAIARKEGGVSFDCMLCHQDQNGAWVVSSYC